MEKTVDFLDGVKRRHGLTSDYQLSKRLRLTRSAISAYRNGDRALDENVALVVAQELQLSPAYVLACTAAERAKRPEVRTAWEKAARTLSRAATVLILLGMWQAFGLPGLSDASASAVPLNTHYALAGAVMALWIAIRAATRIPPLRPYLKRRIAVIAPTAL